METQVAPIDEHVIIESRLISLNSKFATEYLNGTSKSSVSFDFNAIARKDSRVLYHTIAIQSAEIPSSFYNINASNNITNITRAGSAAFNITMPVGNYDSATYLATFKTLYAHVEQQSASDKYTQGVIDEKGLYVFTMRYVAGVTNKHRISYNSKFFNITSVINLDERDKYLVVKATEGVAV